MYIINRLSAALPAFVQYAAFRPLSSCKDLSSNKTSDSLGHIVPMVSHTSW